jgi:hypothetical protein
MTHVDYLRYMSNTGVASKFDFYEREGFRVVPGETTNALLRSYWTVPDRQIDESIVFADERWFSLTRRRHLLSAVLSSNGRFPGSVTRI